MRAKRKHLSHVNLIEYQKVGVKAIAELEKHKYSIL